MRFIVSVLLLSLVFLSSSVLAMEQQRLNWRPPELSSPLKIQIAQADDPAFITVKKSGRFLPSEDKYLVTDQIVIELNENQDAVISLPDDRKLVTKGIQINGGNNVRIIGGSLEALAPADEKLRALLRFAAQSGSVYVEGMVLDTKAMYGLDGILAGSVRHKPDLVADVYIQNTLIKGISSTKKGFHADGFQFYGDAKNLRMDRVSIRSDYQGIFLDPQSKVDGIDLRNIDIDYIHPENGQGYLFYLRSEFNKQKQPPVKLQNIYVGERKNYTPWQEFSIYPPQSRKQGMKFKDNRASFPAFSEVQGFISKGKPLNGPFVTEDTAGLRYVSPGYQDLPE